MTQGERREYELYGRAIGILAADGPVRPDSYSVGVVARLFDKSPEEVSTEVGRFLANVAKLEAGR